MACIMEHAVAYMKTHNRTQIRDIVNAALLTAYA